MVLILAQLNLYGCSATDKVTPCAVTDPSCSPYKCNLAVLNATGACSFCPNLAGLKSSDLNAGLKITNLSNSDLKGADLASIDLSGANLTQTIFTNANLTGANLANANLTQAVLEQTNLTNANLSNANLTNAILYFTKLLNTNLTGAILNGAQICNGAFASSTGANLAGTNVIC